MGDVCQALYPQHAPFILLLHILLTMILIAAIYNRFFLVCFLLYYLSAPLDYKLFEDINPFCLLLCSA